MASLRSDVSELKERARRPTDSQHETQVFMHNALGK